MRKASMWVIAVGTAAAVLGAGVAQARLDTSFGQGGIVRVMPSLPTIGASQHVFNMAAARNGDSFVLVRHCAGSALNCSNHAIFRFRRNGSLDPEFGGPRGFYELPPAGDRIVELAVDSVGRPLILQASADQIFVRRLTRTGMPDQGFGSDGVVAIMCECAAGLGQLAPGPRASVTVVFQRSQRGPQGDGGRERASTEITLFRLKADGSMDRRFGGDGVSSFELAGAQPPMDATAARSGALYLSGARCCGLRTSGYLTRVSARGRFDGRFMAVTRRSMRATRLAGWVNSVIVRPGGKVDLLGKVGPGKGFLLRLNPNGTRHRSFAVGGMRALPLRVTSAALGTRGATLAVVEDRSTGTSALVRILPGGRLDPAFGARGRMIPTTGTFGISVVPQAGRRALTLDPGYPECRTVCSPDPRLTRFVEVR